jgi:hypothetical protein
MSASISNQVAGERVAFLRLDEPRRCGESAVAVPEGQDAVGQVVAGRRATPVLVLPPRGLGGHVAVRVQVVERHLQVAADGLEERVAPEEARHGEEGAVAGRRVDGGAPLGKLAVRVDVDPLRQPRVDARDVPRVREERVQPGEGRADDPPVVRGVDAADDQRLSRGAGEPLEVRDRLGRDVRPRHAHDRERRADRLEHEGRVGRRVKVRRGQVDRAVGVLEGEKRA